MYNELIAMYVYGMLCAGGGFLTGYRWRAYKNEDGDGV